jgi:hypothetical protein
VKIWRRLQQIGAVPMKNAVHVLPNNAQSREDFEWLRTEVVALGGEATVFEASSIQGIGSRRIAKMKVIRAPVDTVRRLPKATVDPKQFHGRIWITRPRPGVDRFSSAWLIRRCIDPDARFAFGASPEAHPEAVPFDMYQPAGFKHEGNRCTFEVLCRRFGIADPAIRRIGEIVHDLDLKDDKFKDTHTQTIGLLIDGLQASIADDTSLLEQGMGLFEALYRSLHGPKRRDTGIC